jgi:hypothetical protein
MGVSIEERRAISRRNGAKSRGPLTHETKCISSRNNLRHGFYATVHHLPDESPEETARLRQRWFHDVAPKTVAEEFLTSECFQANLVANRVHRARRAVVAAQQEAATAAWHDQRDDVVSRLWKELQTTDDARNVLRQLRTTTLGLDALSGQWDRLGSALDCQGYWLPGELTTVVLLSGVPVRATVVSEDADAYRLTLWNLQCEPEPPRDAIERLLKPANRPPALRDVAAELLLPPAAECLARLKQWVADVLVELADDREQVWTDVEAPHLARRTDPKAIVFDPDQERRIHRASSEYRATFYKAYNAIEASRKRAAAEDREATKHADQARSPRSSEANGTAGRAAPAGPPKAAACEAAARSRDEPSTVTAAPAGGGGEPSNPGLESGSRDEPSTVTETPAATEAPVPAVVAATVSRDEPSTVAEARAVARSPEPETCAAGALNTGPRPTRRDDPAPGSEDDWRTPPPTVTRNPDGSLTRKEPSPWRLDPNKPWDELTPKERAAIEALNGERVTERMALW